MSTKDRDDGMAEAAEAALRTKRFLDIERTGGTPPGKKEMAMTRRPRTEEEKADRAKHFLEIERGRKA